MGDLDVHRELGSGAVMEGQSLSAGREVVTSVSLCLTGNRSSPLELGDSGVLVSRVGEHLLWVRG